ncbi:hypothetical protein ANCCEY_14862 [Ancylostoma ceylanicum]|uniref:SEFIR domain-containing protein n=1 Tax=Ancylostoma ceylanicum TaxID=53326 RepID=A0A0D6LEF9_9BILA|nr:hypothetical protein ANCCEY_14862 [Ancylostoma ceylanicum]
MPNIPSPEWSPLLIVDFSEEDGVWLRVEGPASHRARVITVSIFGRHADGSLHPLQSFSIVYPSTGLKWRNVAKGDYVAYAHIHRHDCVLVCDELGQSPFECKLCAHTVVNFTLSSDRASLSWRSLRRMRDSSSSILVALGSAILVLSLCGMTYVFFLRRRVRRTPVQVQEIELQSKPSVLLLTPDDCDEHSVVVLVLSRILEQHAGVTVMLDYHEMSNAVPSDFARLTALIHSIDVREFNDAADSALLDEFGAAIETMVKMMQTHPNWIERRLLTDVVPSDLTDSFIEVPEKKLLLETAEEKREAAEMFGLLPPEENEVVVESPEFTLLAPDSSDDD